MPIHSIESQDLPVAQLFSDFYVVPDYQREYVWGEEEVDRLLSDIYDEYDPNADNENEYFIGSLVVCRSEDGRFELIDGQQRITTLFVIFCAIKLFLEKNGHSVPQTLSNQIAAMNMASDGVEVAQFRVELHYSGGQGILRTFKDPGDFADISWKTRSRSIDNLNIAFQTTQRFLSSSFGSNPQTLKRFYAFFINRVKVIRIETQSLARALKIFETINDRGVGLDSMDLLKNLLFMNADKKTFGKLKTKGESIVDLIYKNKEKPLRFLRYFIFSNFRIDRLREDEIYSWFSKNEHSCGYSTDPIAFVDRLHRAAYTYTQYLAGKNRDGDAIRYLDNIRRLSGASRQHLMLLLAAESMDDENFTKLCEHLEHLLFIYIVARESGREFERKFARWAPEVRMITSPDHLDAFLERNFVPEKKRLFQRFVVGFNEITDSSLQKYRLRYVLAKLNQYVNYNAFKRESDLDLSRFLEKNVEIEHILPKTVEAGFKNTKADTVENYDESVHLLGNLALLEKSINASIGNNDVPEKRKGFKQSTFLLTRLLAEKVQVGNDTSVDRTVRDLNYYPEWDVNTIRSRQKDMMITALKVWGLDQFQSTIPVTD
jgi:hypothetical protein